MSKKVAAAWLCLAASLPCSAFAQEEEPLVDIEGAHDSPLLKRYPGAVVTELNEKEFEEFQFSLADGDGETTTKTVSGSYFEASYSFPLKASCTQIIRNYENAFKAAGLKSRNGKQSPPNAGGWGDSDKWASGEGPIKGRGATAHIVVTCGDFEDALRRNIGKAWVVVAQDMEQKVELDASAMEKEISASGRIALYGINFATGKAELTTDSAKTLEEVGKLLASKAEWKLRVEGHTDNVGSSKSNLELSKKRAAAVKEHLVGKYQVKATQLVTEGFGDTKPLAKNDSDENRARNRRVELVKL